MSMNGAWAKQSESLVDVQVTSAELERTVVALLGWRRGRVVYDSTHGYSIQVDAVWPSAARPEAVVSVTYTNPDVKGHGNENKLHLKVGELALLKAAYPEIRVVLVIGGSREAWLDYVLRAFEYFYDEVIHWNSAGQERLKQIAAAPASVALRYAPFWKDLRNDSSRVKLVPVTANIPSGLVRYQIADALRAQTPKASSPNSIANEVARLCMERSQKCAGAEWRNYLDERWGQLEMSRNYFNPVEAAVEISLTSASLSFKGGIAQDIQVPSFLQSLGITETSLSEDFELYSRRLGNPVYLQCKASGGGRSQHGKNIGNRAKEQITRGILYRAQQSAEGIRWPPKSFHWVGVLDGDWAVTQRQPAKYIHMLQWAGYDAFFGASTLLDNALQVKRGSGNPLLRYLVDVLDCKRA